MQLDHPPAAGTAADTVAGLITQLRAAKPKELRMAAEDYFEAVIERDRLAEYESMLEATFGEPVKPFGVKPVFDDVLWLLVASKGGILKNQCLYLRRFADDHVAFAAFWPWDNPARITLKVGVYARPLPADATS